MTRVSVNADSTLIIIKLQIVLVSKSITPTKIYTFMLINVPFLLCYYWHNG